jgi:aminoglycoside phosphotransferase (APT) family kinase protein
MTPWDAEFELSAGTVGAVLAAQFPPLAGAPVSFLKEGWDSRAFEVAGRFVFRFPKRGEVEEQLVREMALLDAIAPRLPAAVPRYEFHGRPSSLFPYRFGGYVKLAGRDVRGLPPHEAPGDLLRSLGAFLSALHDVPIELARRCGVGHHGWRTPAAYRRRALEAVARLRPALGEARAAACLAFVEAGAARAEASAPGPEGRRLQHNDLSSDHVLVDEDRRLVGIIDWSDVEIGDPAVDLSGVYHFLGDAGTRRVLAAYSAPWNEALVERARFFAGCVGLFQTSYGHAVGSAEEIANGERALALALAGPG